MTRPGAKEFSGDDGEVLRFIVGWIITNAERSPGKQLADTGVD